MEIQAGLVTYVNLSVGDYFYTGNIDITETHIVNFAGISGDFFDVHMDKEFARKKGFSDKIAHGLLILSLVDGLKNRSPVQLNAIASLGWEKWEFKAPVAAEDSGDILLSEQLSQEEVDFLNVVSDAKIHVTNGMKPYLKRHREKMLRANEQIN